MTTTTLTANAMPLEINQYDSKNFEADLAEISLAGKNLKDAIQRAALYATQMALEKGDVTFADKLDAKLALLESDHYLKLWRKHFSALCGDCKKTYNGNETKLFLRKEKDRVFTYKKTMGNTGWRIEKELYKFRKKGMRKIYYDHVATSRLMLLKFIDEETENDISTKIITQAKKLADKAKRYRDGKEVWEGIDSPWIKIIQYLADMPENIVPKQ